MTDVMSSDIENPVTDPVDPAAIGTLLRETREALRRDLPGVASELRIRLVYLQAIEEGRFGDLPGLAYVTGFLRAYGDYLGIDGEGLVARFKESGGIHEKITDLHLPSPVEEGRLPTGSILLLAAVLGAAAYGGWYSLSSKGYDPIDLVASLPDNIARLVDGDGKPESTTPEATETQPEAESVPIGMVDPDEGSGLAGTVGDQPVPDDAVPVATQSEQTDPETEIDTASGEAPATAAPDDVPADADSTAAAAAPESTPPASNETESAARRGETESDAPAPVDQREATLPARSVSTDRPASMAAAQPGSARPTVDAPANDPVAADVPDGIVAAAPPAAPSPPSEEEATPDSVGPPDAPAAVDSGTIRVESAPMPAPRREGSGTSVEIVAVPPPASMSPTVDRSSVPPETRVTEQQLGRSPGLPETSAPPRDAVVAEPRTTVDQSSVPPESRVAEQQLGRLPGSPEASASRRDTPVAQPRPTVDPALHRVVIKAVSDTWIEIRVGSATPVFSRVLRTGETVEAPRQSGVRMATGNAGALQVLVDDQPIPPLGRPGAILRNFALDVESLMRRAGRTP